MRLIVLTEAEAAKVRGRSPTNRLMAIDPIPLADGDTFVLAPGVADLKEHADVANFLKALPERDVRDAEKLGGIDATLPEKLLARGDFSDRIAPKENTP